jgi:hypothetical protein
VVFRYFNSDRLIRLAVYGFNSVVVRINSRSDGMLGRQQCPTLNRVVDAQTMTDFTRQNAQD